MVGGSTRAGDRNVTGGDRHTYERGYGFRRRGDRWLPDRWTPMGGFGPPSGGGLNDGDPVSTWADSSGNGHNATQTGSARPTFKTNIINGKPVVRFTSAGLSGLNLVSNISGATPWTSFAVMKTAATTKRIESLTGNAGFGRPTTLQRAQDDSVYSISREAYVNSSFQDLGFHVLSASNSVALFQIWFDGAVISGAQNPITNTGDFIQLGYDSVTPDYSDGDIAEVIHYNLLLSSTDRANIEKYLGTKYGITVAGGTAVDPSTVSGLVGWWKADSLAPVPTGLSDGDPVSTWLDSSTGGHNATQTGTARPTFKTNIINGHPVVRFTSAGQSGLNLTTPVSGVMPFTGFAVMKEASLGGRLDTLSGNDGGRPFVAVFSGGTLYSENRQVYVSTPEPSLAFHVISALHNQPVTTQIYLDGTNTSAGAASFANVGDFAFIGYDGGTTYGNGDIAEIIVYSGALALRAKLFLVVTVLISTGQITSSAEADALLAAGDLVALEAYLIEHGVPVEQARDTLEPMAVGDRANIEKYLGTKYGITVAGGTAVDPSTVAGLVGWWKADSLG